MIIKKISSNELTSYDTKRSSHLKDNLPFQTVENEGFRNLMKTTVLLYSVPGRQLQKKREI